MMAENLGSPTGIRVINGINAISVVNYQWREILCVLRHSRPDERHRENCTTEKASGKNAVNAVNGVNAVRDQKRNGYSCGAVNAVKDRDRSWVSNPRLSAYRLRGRR